jgi:phosphoribosylanthranilate isomerase
LDTYKSSVYGGTGKGFDRTLAVLAKEYGRRIIVAGGLNPDNVYDVIREISPYGVDVSSGIESSPGKKNAELMEEFIKEVRRAERM